MSSAPSPVLSRRNAFLLFAIVVFAWGINWALTRTMVASVPPLWMTTIRSAIATVVLLALQLGRGTLILPRRGDMPVVLAIALFHMVGFSLLVAIGLQFVPVGRSIVLGYTTPLWVVPGAWLFLHEKMTRWRLIGVVIGLVGLAVMLNPLAFDWGDGRAVLGTGVLLVGALSWTVSILYTRAHRWISSPFQLVVWQTLLATLVLAGAALAIDGVPHIVWTPELAGAFLYGGVFGVALAYWAMAMVNRSLPAVTTSLGILATPVVGTACSVLFLGEMVTWPLVVAMVLILGGIAVGTISSPPSLPLSPSRD